VSSGPAPALVNIRLLTKHDLLAWHNLRVKLWNNPPPDREEVGRLWLNERFIVWLAENNSNEIIGFIETQVCNRADGCESDAILYIEGWYVEPDYQKQGVGSALMRTAEQWARDHGLKELGSDALIENDVSHHAHKKLGFTEVDRQISYMKKL
jgi:aminoglycoside 6'-N-acetyltransferase I